MDLDARRFAACAAPAIERACGAFGVAGGVLSTLTSRLHGPLDVSLRAAWSPEYEALLGPASPLGFRVGLRFTPPGLLLIAPDEEHAVALAEMAPGALMASALGVLRAMGAIDEDAGGESVPEIGSALTADAPAMSALEILLASLHDLLATLTEDLGGEGPFLDLRSLEYAIRLRRGEHLVDLGCALSSHHPPPRIFARVNPGPGPGRRGTLPALSEGARWVSDAGSALEAVLPLSEVLAPEGPTNPLLAELSFFGAALDACLSLIEG